MSKSIPDGALVVVADGAKAVLLRRHGPSDKLSLREERRLAPKDLVNDGPSGSRPEDQTPRQTDEATFAKQLVGTLARMHEGGEFSALVLVADPQTLGQLRDAMHKTLESAVVFTLAKDYTNHPLQEIEALLA